MARELRELTRISTESGKDDQGRFDTEEDRRCTEVTETRSVDPVPLQCALISVTC